MKRIISILICALLTFNLLGCGKNSKVEKVASKDNQVINNISENGIKDYFITLDKTISAYVSLSNEFKENYKSYSKSELLDYTNRVKKYITEFGVARQKVGTYNKKFTEVYNAVLGSLRNLSSAANILINEDNSIENPEEKSIEQYNKSVDTMKYILENQKDLEKSILDSSK